jgi:hypothetical protein
MRFMMAAACTAILLTSMQAVSPASSAPGPSVRAQGAIDLSSASKKKRVRKAPKKEQYLRAVPSTPPGRAKM